MCDRLETLSPTNGVFAFCAGIHDKKDKYGICICAESLRFFLFNTKFHRFKAAALLESTPVEFPFLKHKCYLDTSLPVPYGAEDIEKAIEAGKVWEISADMKKAIKTKALFHEQLAGKYEALIEENF